MPQITNWTCGVTTVPDGRVLCYRTMLTSGPTVWSAALEVAQMCERRKCGASLMKNLLKKRFGVHIPPGDLRHILSHTDFGCGGCLEIQLEIYHIDFIRPITFFIPEDTQTMAIPFPTIVNDLESGVWCSNTKRVFNLLDTMCKGEFRR